MRLRVTANDLPAQRADLAVCFAHEGDAHPREVTDRELRGALADQMRVEGFRGRAGDQLVWNANGRYPARRFAVVGLGPERGTAESLRQGCARAARLAASVSATRLALRLPGGGDGSAASAARAAAEGALLGAYQFDRYLTEASRKQVRLKSIELAAARVTAAVKQAVAAGEVGARAVCLARDWVNEAPSRKAPRQLARIARQAVAGGRVQCKVLGPAELKRAGFHALLAVSRGSQQPPQVVHLTYRPAASKRKSRKRVLLVGKGVTFDSGGLNLKPGDSMLTMKMDMAGAAAVLAAMTVLPQLGCAVEVHALLGLVENMTGGNAYKPGDILDTLSGKTVEVGNTDAEGRLVLCDLLAYGAAKIKPTEVVDLATLTGACVVALGTMASGLFTRHDALGDALLAAAGAAGEKLWPMPMYDEYLQLLQKGPADLRNVAGRWGGAITAALFLGEFVPRALPWAHLDIAGPAFAEQDQPEAAAGATGAGVLTLVRWLESC